ncbi:MAG: DUF87 domain-containing protein [Flavobacterium sp.]|nr:DUF87 domain-containing protein [Flavobacterium sp.]
MNKYLYIKDNRIIYKNGVYGMAYKIILPEKYSLGEDDYIDLNKYWYSAIKDLPIGSIFYKQDAFIENEYDTSNLPDSNYLQKDTKLFYKNWNYLKHECYVFFILPNQIINNKNLTNPFLKVSKKVFEDFDTEIENFSRSVESTLLSLKNIKLQGGNKLSIEAFTENELISYTDLYFNLFETNFSSDMVFENNYVKIGNKFASIVCCLDEEKMPDEFSYTIKDKDLPNDSATFFKNYGDNFGFNLNFSHIYNQIAVIDDNRMHLNDLKQRNVQLHKMRSFDSSNKIYASITDGIIEDITKTSNLKLIRGHNNVIVIGVDEEALNSNILKTIDAFREINVIPYVPIGNYLIALFNNSFPFYSQYFTDKQFYIASLEIFSSLIMNATEYKNDSVGVIFNSRISNIPVRVDVWDKKKENIKARNFMILAPTGEGKSVLANHIVRHYLEIGTKIVIVDLGGSYKKLSALYPNETIYVTYKEGDSIPVNPFQLYNNDNLTTDKIEELIIFVANHYKRDTEISELEKTSLRKIVEYYYKEINHDHSMISFISFIKQNKNDLLEKLSIKEDFFKMDEFLHLMSEFIEDGIYSFLYKKDNSIIDSTIKDKSIIVFELDAVRNNPLLLSIMLNLVDATINEVIWKDKTKEGIVFYDEVAEQLKWNNVLRSIGYSFQAIRKQSGSVGIILQSESQLPKNEITEAMIENTQVLYVLGAKNYKSIQNRFNLSEHAYYQMSSINTNFSAKIPYSEMFIMRGKKHQVYRLILPKKVYWAYQTEGLENEKLLEIYNETKDMQKAIEKIITLN